MNNILRLLTISLTTKYFALITCGTALAQVPQRIPYQAIARNASGVAIANTVVKVRFSIRDSVATGPVRYQETHTPTTSALGLFSVNVGAGAVVSGSFSSINWGKNAKFMQMELDQAGGNTFTNLGTTQMMSVPYALNSGNGVANGTASNQIMYWNGTAWTQLNPGSNGQTLTICNGILTWTTGGICPANLPALSTSAVSAVTTTTASSGGSITSDGGGSITARGVCWSTSQNPTVALSTKTINGAGSGSFTSSLTGLNPGTTYYVRAYATNGAGTAYGNQVSFSTTTSTNPVDIDGNVYTTVTIGNQVWMKENLKVSKYRNGDAILEISDSTQWESLASLGSEGVAACCFYNNNSSNVVNYGRLYNCYAVQDSRGLCPTSWHVPTDEEWKTLELFLGLPPSELDFFGAGVRGAAQNIGGKLKVASSNWVSPNIGANNSSGFSALPGGSREINSFGGIGANGSWWSASDGLTESNAWFRFLGSGSAGIGREEIFKNQGYSVRCLRD
jgi:uncharacterized protein (TIGR02145 family)